MKHTALLITLGVTLLVFALVAPAITQIPILTEENWSRFLMARTLWVFVLTFFGLLAIFYNFLKSGIARWKGVAVLVVLAALAAFYPGGLQLIVGPKEVKGSIANVQYSKKTVTYYISPQSKAFRRHNPLKVDYFNFNLVSGDQQAVKLVRKDTLRILDQEKNFEAKNETYYCKYLPYVARFLRFERIDKN